MKKKYIVFIIILLLILIGIGVVLYKKFNNQDNYINISDIGNNSGATSINTIEDLFPNKVGETSKYTLYDQTYDVKVIRVDKADNKKTIVMEHEENQSGSQVTVKMTYEIQDNKLVESGKYIQDGKETFIMSSTELLNGSLAEGYEWQSENGTVTNKITKVESNRITVESKRKIEYYQEGSTTSTEKESIYTRVFEINKGLVSLNSEIK